MSHSQFSKSERDELSILLRKGYSHRSIAKVLGKHRSAVDREVSRNSTRRGIYDAIKAHHKAYVRRREARYQNMKINESLEFVIYLAEKLKVGWVPEQIAHRWNGDHRRGIHFSFKAIYKYLYSSYGQRLCHYLPSKHYNPWKRRGAREKKIIIKNRVSISERPKVINLRQRFGDFEGDVLGAIKIDKERLVALVERKSRKLFAVRVSRLKYAVDGFKKLLKPCSDILQSITFDNGPENARHLELGCPTYFADPYSAWQKGQVENTLGRLRRFIKKKSSLKLYSDQAIEDFVEQMNNTPRKCLKWKTPNEVFLRSSSLKVRNKHIHARF
jgi:IS30 family transposase